MDSRKTVLSFCAYGWISVSATADITFTSTPPGGTTPGPGAIEFTFFLGDQIAPDTIFFDAGVSGSAIVSEMEGAADAFVPDGHTQVIGNSLNIPQAEFGSIGGSASSLYRSGLEYFGGLSPCNPAMDCAVGESILPVPLDDRNGVWIGLGDDDPGGKAAASGSFDIDVALNGVTESVNVQFVGGETFEAVRARLGLSLEALVVSGAFGADVSYTGLIDGWAGLTSSEPLEFRIGLANMTRSDGGLRFSSYAVPAIPAPSVVLAHAAAGLLLSRRRRIATRW